jgi:nitroreductase
VGAEPGFFEVARSQRACRSFSAEAVPDALVSRLLEAATGAPSAENSQPWRFVVVTDGEQRGVLADLTRRAWEGGGRAYEEGRLPRPLFDDVDRGATGGLAGAPVAIVVCADTTAVPAPAIGASIWPAVQNLLLAATAVGLGSTLTTLATVQDRPLRASLGLPGEVDPVAVVFLGWPARPLGAPRRRAVDEVTYRDRWGAPWPGSRTPADG